MAYLQSLDCICQLEPYISRFVLIILFSSNFVKIQKRRRRSLDKDLLLHTQRGIYLYSQIC